MAAEVAGDALSSLFSKRRGAAARLEGLPEVLLDDVVEFLSPPDALAMHRTCAALYASLLGASYCDINRVMFTSAVPDAAASSALAARLARHRVLRQLRLERFPHLDDAAVAPILARHATTLRELSLSGTGVASPAADAPQLRSLTLSNIRNLMAPAIVAPRLRELDVSSTFLSDHDLARVLRTTVGGDGGALEVLRARSCKNVTFASAPALPALRVLDVTRTQVTDATLGELCAAAPLLETLYLSECRRLLEPTVVGDRMLSLSMRSAGSVRRVTLRTPALRHLDVSECRFSAASLLEALNAVAGTLETLVAVNCHDVLAVEGDGVGGAAAAGGFAPMPRVTRVDLSQSNVRDATVRALVGASPSLTSLTLRQCFLVRDEWSLAHDALTELSLESTHTTDAAVAATLHGCPALRRLSVRNCDQVTGVGFAHASLEAMDISHSRFTRESLTAVTSAEAMPRLRELQASSVRKVGDAVIVSPSLEVINFGFNPELASMRIAAPSLTSLDINRTLTLQGEDVEVHAPNLREVHVEYCNSRVIARVQAACPGVKCLVGRDVWGGKVSWGAAVASSASSPPRAAARHAESPADDPTDADDVRRGLEEGKDGVGGGGAAAAAPVSSPDLEALREIAAELKAEVAAEGLSDLQRYGLRKRHQKAHAAVIREERRLRQAAAAAAEDAPASAAATPASNGAAGSGSGGGDGDVGGGGAAANEGKADDLPVAAAERGTEADVAASDGGGDVGAGADGAGSSLPPPPLPSSSSRSSSSSKPPSGAAGGAGRDGRGRGGSVGGGGAGGAAGGHRDGDVMERSSASSVVSGGDSATFRLESPELLVLEMRATDMKRELDGASDLTELQRYALKRQYQRCRAAVIREERRLRELRAGGGGR
uniref:F-box domain-containing protein n=1 Tax=Bicosoecida sp. CB-2014 TaxID=1486930 RepID=A0A7S1CD54_9STRA